MSLDRSISILNCPSCEEQWACECVDFKDHKHYHCYECGYTEDVEE